MQSRRKSIRKRKSKVQKKPRKKAKYYTITNKMNINISWRRDERSEERIN